MAGRQGALQGVEPTVPGTNGTQVSSSGVQGCLQACRRPRRRPWRLSVVPPALPQPANLESSVVLALSVGLHGPGPAAGALGAAPAGLGQRGNRRAWRLSVLPPALPQPSAEQAAAACQIAGDSPGRPVAVHC